jgi:hypothetical protein
MPIRKDACIIFVAWGKQFIDELSNNLPLNNLDSFKKFLITDLETVIPPTLDVEVIRVQFKTNGFLRKTEMLDFLPIEEFSTYVFLDTDLCVLGNINLGIEKAKQFGIALAPAPHYSLHHWWFVDEIMRTENVPLYGQLHYNTGVIFFDLQPHVREVFKLWNKLAVAYPQFNITDQPFFSIAMEKLNFNPYTLSQNYNYRGFGDYIVGDIYIWHSRDKLPPEINTYTEAWPNRRYVLNGKINIFEQEKQDVIQAMETPGFLKSLINRLCFRKKRGL